MRKCFHHNYFLTNSTFEVQNGKWKYNDNKSKEKKRKEKKEEEMKVTTSCDFVSLRFSPLLIIIFTSVLLSYPRVQPPLA